MSSPFPGMDPFLEQQEWSDFHQSLNVAAAELLGAIVEPRYFARIQRREYHDRFIAEELPKSIVRSAPKEPVERRESYLVIRETGSGEVVTVIETLSPANKRPNSTGRDEYLSKRDMTLESPVHLVELDLLRGGERLPMQSLPGGDYYALVSRAKRRPRVDVYAWPLQRRLPKIPIPLKPEDPEPKLDLQAAFITVYDRAKYHLSVDYARELTPPVSEETREWMTGFLSGNPKT